MLKALRGLKAILDHKVQLGPKVHRDRRGISGLRGHREPLVHKDPREIQAPKDLKVTPDPRVHREM